ncbi:hypothetical protein RN001_000245 [Aquatica leii]|uniref:Uncharacterized protein n=1 Tax=Aquatica leii TaxID=1421715 RepID=A0AAN7PEN5_9COLE|nr:hypothetical protein RN001_000245 [Aquatica leii]
MKFFVFFLIVVVTADAYFAPLKTMRSSQARAAREVESVKTDLEGSESAYVVYPYLSYPHFYHTPLVYLGK